MSATLYWRPYAPPRGNDLSDALKFKLRDRYDLMSGSARLDWNNDVAYLEGLRDAGIEGADELLRAIEKHEEVVIWLES